MPNCLMLVPSLSSALEPTTNTLSLFHILEQLQLPHLPAVVPLNISVLIGFEPNELNQIFECTIQIAEAGNENLVDCLNPFLVTARTPRHRHRIFGLPILFQHDGNYVLSIRMRPQNGEWIQSPIRWPLAVEIGAAEPLPNLPTTEPENPQ